MQPAELSSLTPRDGLVSSDRLSPLPNRVGHDEQSRDLRRAYTIWATIYDPLTRFLRGSRTSARSDFSPGSEG